MKNIFYFSFGANKTSEMMNAIIGRTPKGFPAILENYELFVQSWKNIPKNAKKILKSNWDSKFKSYCGRPKKGKIIFGTAWYISKQERKLVGNWELHNIWSKNKIVNVRDKRGRVYRAQTDIVNDFKTKNVVSGEKYKPFVVNKNKILKVARKVRHIAV